MEEHSDPHGEDVAGEPAHNCFLCAYSDRPCEVPSVDGTVLRIEERGARNRWPVVLLATADGAEAAVVLPEHVRQMAARIAALPGERQRGLRVRVFHLRHPAESTHHPRAAGRRTYLCTPVSAIVVEPDALLNITDINNAEYCVRQYPLRRMVPSAPTGATLRGTIIHNAFKEMLKGREEAVDGLLNRALQAQVTDLALRQISREQIAEDVRPHLDALARWQSSERQTLWSGTLRARAETFLLAPEVGLKGRLDALIEDERGNALLELKTGNAHAELPRREHRWQVYGYQTLLAARRPADRQRPGATLLYSGVAGQAEGYGVPFALRELHRVLELRNALALTHVTGIVPAPPGARKCARCALRRECLRASHRLGWEPPESEEQPEPVSTEDAMWFAEQYELLRQEALALEAESRTLWQLSSSDRRAAGIALGNLTLAGEPRMTPGGEWEYTFACENTSELREGDAVLLSDGDPVRGAVVSGTILHLDEHGATVWTPERIANPSLLDRYGSDIVHGRTVRNLWRWLEIEPRRRALVAGRLKPTFGPVPAIDDLPASFNAEQRETVARALAAQDLLLIQGPPGTGKTSVVAEIAARAVARGERVLVAAFTNQAVDNVLLRLSALGMRDFVRLGHELSVAPELHPYRLAARAHAWMAEHQTEAPVAQDAMDTHQALDPAAMRAALRAAPLVAATTATWSAERYDGVGEPLHFDLAVVDEASQLTTPALLGALRFARRLVLVGDAHQLPPLVMSEEAGRQGLKRSLFESLLERWGEVASVTLRQQYRMHPAICGFPSVEFYGGQLVAAGDARTRTLNTVFPQNQQIGLILAPERPIVFVDVPPRTGGEEEVGKVSKAQARVVRALVLALLRAGVAPDQIGAIAPYRAQVAAIRQQLATLPGTNVTVDTVDRFQGGERDVILFSFGGHVATQSYGRGIEFLADPNRLNVALTRARSKLVLIGDRQWLTQVPLLSRLLDYCANLYGGRGGIVNAQHTPISAAQTRAATPAR